MTNPVDQEIDAIKALLTVLGPLDPKARQSALDYVLKRLDIKLEVASASGQSSPEALPPGEPASLAKADANGNIKAFKESKQPKSATEMAALVAYYLAHKASERKQAITTKDIETQFQIAEFPLPEKLQFTLPNAKAAGYLDSAGVGQYKLNPVGYNLIAHSLPRKDGATRGKTQRRPAKARKATRPKK